MPPAPPTTPTGPGPGVAVAVKLRHAGKPRIEGDWIAQVGEDRLWLLDPSGKARAELSPEDGAALIGFPGHYSNVAQMTFPCDGRATRFELAGPGLEHIEEFIRKGMVAAGPEARRRVLIRSIKYLVIGVLSAGVGGVVTVLSLSHPSNSGRSTVLIGAIVVGIYEIYRGIAGLIDYSRLNRAAAMIRAVGPRTMPKQVVGIASQPVTARPGPVPPAGRMPVAKPGSGPAPRQPSSVVRPASAGAVVVVAATAKPVSRAEARFTKIIMITLGVLLAGILIGGIWITLTLPPQYSQSNRAPSAPPTQAAPPPASSAPAPSMDAHPAASAPLAPAPPNPERQEPTRTVADAPPASDGKAATEIVFTGDIEWAEGVQSLKPGRLVSTTRIRLIRERQNYTLSSPLECDTTSAGTWTNSFRRTTARSIAAGTTINCFMVHADAANPAVSHIGAGITFPTRILGIIGSNARLDASDGAVGAPGIVYPTGGKFRQWFDGDSDDSITISPDLRTLTLRSHSGRWVDQIRVITAAPP